MAAHKKSMHEADYFRLLERRVLLGILGIVLLVIADISVNALWRHFNPSEAAADPPDHPRHLIDFSLIDQVGHPITRKDLAHKIEVINFLFTSCSLVFPYVDTNYRQTTNEPDVRLLSLTVDPIDDTVPVLAQYVHKFGADPGRWSLATGNLDLMDHLIETIFLSHDTDTNFSFMPGSFANSQRIALVDSSGEIVKYFDGLNLDAAHAVVQEIRQLRSSTP